MKEDEIIIEVANKKVCGGMCNRCSDFDEDCLKVIDHLNCFLGLEDSMGYAIGIADGYCPFIHQQN